MADFSLCVTSNDFIIFRLLKIFFLMLFSSHQLDILDEHADVGTARELMGIDYLSIDNLNVRMNFIPFRIVCKVIINSGEISIGILEEVLPTFVINVGGVV